MDLQLFEQCLPLPQTNFLGGTLCFGSMERGISLWIKFEQPLIEQKVFHQQQHVRVQNAAEIEAFLCPNDAIFVGLIDAH